MVATRGPVARVLGAPRSGRAHGTQGVGGRGPRCLQAPAPGGVAVVSTAIQDPIPIWIPVWRRIWRGPSRSRKSSFMKWSTTSRVYWEFRRSAPTCGTCSRRKPLTCGRRKPWRCAHHFSLDSFPEGGAALIIHGRVLPYRKASVLRVALFPLPAALPTNDAFQRTTYFKIKTRDNHMKALVYNGPRDVRVREVPDATIERPTDVLVRITSTNICGSDLHMYEGRTDMEKGRVLGHENLGQVVEVGEAVDRIKVGDWVCLPFNVSCGFCKNCERGLTGFCLTTNPGTAGAAYGF